MCELNKYGSVQSVFELMISFYILVVLQRAPPTPNRPPSKFWIIFT